MWGAQKPMASREAKNLVSVGLVMLPHWLRVAASRVSWARRERLRPRGDGWQRAPSLGCGTT